MDMTYAIKITCQNCGKAVHESSTSSEVEAKDNLRKGTTAGEVHDCKVAATPGAVKP